MVANVRECRLETKVLQVRLDKMGEFYFLSLLTWKLYNLPLFNLIITFCHSLLGKFKISPDRNDPRLKTKLPCGMFTLGR
jgi:hypothetical protein